jgi:uncharacterized small protein (TIGR04563 family)
MMTDPRRVTLYVPDALLAALDAEAARQDRSRSWIVQQILRAALPKIAAHPLPTLAQAPAPKVNR